MFPYDRCVKMRVNVAPRRIGLAALSLAMATPAMAQENTLPPLVPPEVAMARTAGRAISFVDRNGVYFGTESFLPGNRVTWTNPIETGGEDCITGVWQVKGDHVCFTYDYAPERENCWRFHDEGGNLGAYINGDMTQTYLLGRDLGEPPRHCPGWVGS